MAANQPGAPAGIVFRRLADAGERRRAGRLLVHCGLRPDDAAEVWYGLSDLTAAEASSLAGVAVVRPVGPTTVLLCALTISDEYRGRGLGRRLVYEVADRLRASGGELIVASAAPDSAIAMVLTKVGFALRDDSQGLWSLPL